MKKSQQNVAFAFYRMFYDQSWVKIGENFLFSRVATFLENLENLEKAWNLKMPLENLENLEFSEKCSPKSGILVTF